MTSQTVLMVDDSIPIHALVGMHLEPHVLQLHSAYDGESALSMAASIHPSLILLDVSLPQIDGFEVCRRLKADPLTSDTAVVFLSADGSPDNKSKGLELGAVDYITKPIEPERLRARVRLALRTQLWRDRSDLIDQLTGLWNESHLAEHMAAELAWANRSGSRLACIMVDIEPLGRADEHFDDVAGEEILRAVSEIFLSHCRGSEDTLHYCGNRKFAAVLSRTDLTGAEHLAERVRLQIERELRRDDGGAIVRCSFGIADTAAETDVPLLERAVTAAHHAKQLLRMSASIDP